MSNEVEDEWLCFLNSGKIDNCQDRQSNSNSNSDTNEPYLNRPDIMAKSGLDTKQESAFKIIPKCSDIYISTKTKISYLSQVIDLNYLFWCLPVIEYHQQCEGIIKKQMKFQSHDRDTLETIIAKTQEYYYYRSDIINSIDNPDGKIKFKDTRKVSIGICKKDILNTRCKVKSAFYNCFVLGFRIRSNDSENSGFREIHIKIFNTGKLEIPGIKDDALLDIVLDKLVSTISKIDGYSEIICQKEKTETVLINSNFNCGYYIDRDKMYQLLRNKYNINCSYDPCSYPGIQCRFYYNNNYPDDHDNSNNSNNSDFIQTGCQPLNGAESDGYMKISFMIFRTGSVLMVGKCSETILNKIYLFIRRILETDHNIVGIDDFGEIDSRQRVKSKKHKKRFIYVDC